MREMYDVLTQNFTAEGMHMACPAVYQVDVDEEVDFIFNYESHYIPSFFPTAAGLQAPSAGHRHESTYHFRIVAGRNRRPQDADVNCTGYRRTTLRRHSKGQPPGVYRE
jgi:hypothetical protein